VHYLDLATLRVGIPQADQSFKGITMPFIAEKCSLTLRRTERAVADLVASGLLTVYPLCEKLAQGWNSVSVFHRRKQPMLAVANNMPENATLFQPTHPAYEVSIVKNIVQAYSGELTLSKIHLGGAKVCIFFKD